MKIFRNFLVSLCLVTLCKGAVFAQSGIDGKEPHQAYKWPLVVMLQFHSLGMPFKDLQSTFSNVGIGLGTELSYNRKQNLLQTLQIGYYHNQNAGDGISVSSQFAYRPHFGPMYTELKAGLGWNYTFHPNTTLIFHQGEWKSTHASGKGMLMIPLGITLGYQKNHPHSFINPFISYQFFVLQGYNPSVPVVPNQLLQLGSRIYFSK